MSYDLWIFGRQRFDVDQWESLLSLCLDQPGLGGYRIARDGPGTWRLIGESALWIKVDAPPAATDRRIEDCGPAGAIWYATLSCNSGCADEVTWLQLKLPYLALATGLDVAVHDCTPGAHELGCFEDPRAYAEFIANHARHARSLRKLRRKGLVGPNPDDPFDLTTS